MMTAKLGMKNAQELRCVEVCTQQKTIRGEKNSFPESCSFL
jgi:hypothetical protein